MKNPAESEQQGQTSESEGEKEQRGDQHNKQGSRRELVTRMEMERATKIDVMMGQQR